MRDALPDAIYPDSPTPLWRAIDQGIAAFKDEGDERPVILVLSDGKDSGQVDFRQRAVSQVDVIERARRDDVMIYAVGMRSRGGRRRRRASDRRGFGRSCSPTCPIPAWRAWPRRRAADVEIRLGQDLGAAFEQVVDELHSQYLIGFRRPSATARCTTSRCVWRSEA